MRIVQKTTRRLLTAIGGSLLLLFTLQLIRYAFTHGQTLWKRWLIYAYQLPTTVVPLLSFFVALCLGQEDESRALCRWRLLWIPWALMALGILTNDWHQLAYEVAADGSCDVHRGLMFIAWGWEGLLLLATFGVVLFRSHRFCLRKYTWIPVAFLALCLSYFIAYFIGGGNKIVFFDVFSLNFQEVYAFMIVSFWESCIQLDLIPSNGAYTRLFHYSSVHACIDETDTASSYRSEGMLPLTEKQRRLARQGALMVNGHTRLQAAPLSSGYVYWMEDLTAVTDMNDYLKDVAGQLSEETVILQRENELKKEQAQYETQNRMYDLLAEDLRPQLDEIEGLLQENTGEEPLFREKLMRATVLCAYVKRQANLHVLSWQQSAIDLSDLYLSVKESLDYGALAGPVCRVFMEGSGKLPGTIALQAYERFETVWEQVWPQIECIQVRLTMKETLYMQMDWEPLAHLDRERNRKTITWSWEKDGDSV